MNNKELQIDEILKNIAEEISITPSMAKQAISSYEAVGKWFDGLPYDVIFAPQGSMNLGTTIKPVSDQNDYDIDAICLLKDGQSLLPESIKNIVGNRLKENKMYVEKLEEGKRCWKIQHKNFHMDILPCVPRINYSEPDQTEIRLTHKINSYQFQNRYSNPYGYHKWFVSRMLNAFNEAKKMYSIRNQVKIEEVPEYVIKTPLQIVIQLLKRHRDIMFKDDKDDLAPISIIITTLAAEAYQGENSVYEALRQILLSMPNYIQQSGGIYYIANPVMPLENFADKWKEHPERKAAFYKWLERARLDLYENPLNFEGLDNICEAYSKVMGKAPVLRAFNKMGEKTTKAREAGNLFIGSIGTGLTTVSGAGITQVKDHTFYGKIDET